MNLVYGGDMFSDEEKRHFLKAFTSLFKEANGKGPRNIYIRYFEDELHIVMQGVLSEFEKHLVKQFGQEAIDTLRSFYERDMPHGEKRFLEILEYKYDFRYVGLVSDFIQDEFIYKMIF